MKNRQIAARFLCGAMSLFLLAGCGSTVQNSNAADTDSGVLSIAEQGIFSAGGITVTSNGTFDPKINGRRPELVRPPMWITPMCCIRSPQRKLGFPWCSSTATVSPAWAG